MKKYLLTTVALVAFAVTPSLVFAAETTTLQTQLMTYLPYILIGGAVILLISIVGILLSKKKENTEGTPVEIPPVAPTVEDTPPAETAEVTPEQITPVNMENISTNLYTPTESKPTIQETMESNTMTEIDPITQPEFIPTEVPATEQTQSSDLQAILQGEASASPMGPVTDHVMEETPAIAPVIEDTPVLPEAQAMPSFEQFTKEQQGVTQGIPTTPVINPTETILPDLQQFVNNQVAEVPPMETPAPIEASIQDFNPAPATDTTAPIQTDTPAETPFSI